MTDKTKLWIALSLVPQVLLVKILGSYPEWVETYYSNGLYPIISRFNRMLWGWLPLSVGDFLYLALLIGLIRYIYVKGKKLWLQPKKTLLDLGVVLSLAYAIFHLSWGMNYYRLPLEEKMGLTREYSTEQLDAFTAYLIQKTNELQLELTHDSTIPVEIPYDLDRTFEITIEGYKKLATENEQWSYLNSSQKKSIYSLWLSYMGYSGYLNPFTNEAQVNSKITALRFPSVSGHEVGHQIGYSSESATNFIGFLVTTKNEDPYFKYAAYFHSLSYCLGNLKKLDEKKFDHHWWRLNKGVVINFKQVWEHNQQYESFLEPIFKWAFNIFLKANNQVEGIKSYNSVVGLLISYHQQHGF